MPCSGVNWAVDACNRLVARRFFLHSFSLPEKLKTLLRATLSAASIKKTGRKAQNESRATRARVSRPKECSVGELTTDRSIDLFIDRDMLIF